ncbi:PepSY domain-containing protein [Stutzerimonas azotifigens]|uniref:PepSY domain-containing protein n=1 Tax=Stutzerimonas azotifigens TaxID=291995 RepID=UPI0004187E85|nr:PepSY domain-containing protein [Stutzerimonas azotifigens]
MKTLTTCLTAAVLAFSAGTALARDVGPDEVARLLQAGTIQPLEKFNEAALAKHPGFRVDETDLDEEHGRFIYQVELRDDQGRQWDMEFDAATGEILKDEQDD